MTTVVLLALSAESLVLFDFETEAELRKWVTNGERCEMRLVGEHATSGRRALRLVVREGEQWPSAYTTHVPHNWTGYRVLRADVYNPQDERIPFMVRIDDVESRENKSWYSRKLTLAPGRNLVEVRLSRLPTIDEKREIRLNAVRSFHYSMMSDAPAGRTVYIDNVRLEKTDRPAVSRRRGPTPLTPGATVVTLTTGRRFICKVLDADEKKVRVRTAFASLELKRSQIKSIEGPGGEEVAAVSLFKADFEDRNAELWTMGRIVRGDRGSVIEGVMDEGRLRVRSSPYGVRFKAGEGLMVRFRYLVSGPGERVTMVLCGEEMMAEAAVPVRVRGRWQAAELGWSDFRGSHGRSKPGEMEVGLLNWFLPGATNESRFLMDDIDITGPREREPYRKEPERAAEFAAKRARSFVLLDAFETNMWRSTKANCTVALELSSRFRHGGRRSLSFHKAEKVTHDGRISRPVRLPRGAKGLRFWVMKGEKKAPALGIGLHGGDTHFGFDSNELNATLRTMPKGAWKQVEVFFDPERMTSWPRGRELDLAGIDTLIISVGDNKTRKDFGRALFIDDMELILARTDAALPAAKARGLVFREDFERGLGGWEGGNIAQAPAPGGATRALCTSGRARFEGADFQAGAGMELSFRYMLRGPGGALVVAIEGEGGKAHAVLHSEKGRWREASLLWLEFERVKALRARAVEWKIEGSTRATKFYLDDVVVRFSPPSPELLLDCAGERNERGDWRGAARLYAVLFKLKKDPGMANKAAVAWSKAGDKKQEMVWQAKAKNYREAAEIAQSLGLHGWAFAYYVQEVELRKHQDSAFARKRVAECRKRLDHLRKTFRDEGWIAGRVVGKLPGKGSVSVLIQEAPKGRGILGGLVMDVRTRWVEVGDGWRAKPEDAAVIRGLNVGDRVRVEFYWQGHYRFRKIERE